MHTHRTNRKFLKRELQKAFKGIRQFRIVHPLAIILAALVLKQT